MTTKTTKTTKTTETPAPAPQPDRRPRQRQGQKLSAKVRREAQDRFLQAFVERGIVLQAAAAAAVTRQAVYDWRKSDPLFAARYALAEEDVNDAYRAEIRRRGLEGWDEPVYQGGELVGTIRRFDGNLLRFIAQSRMPEFRDKLDVTSNNETVGAGQRGSIDKIIADPAAASLACELLEHIGRATPAGGDAGGAGAARE